MISFNNVTPKKCFTLIEINCARKNIIMLQVPLLDDTEKVFGISIKMLYAGLEFERVIYYAHLYKLLFLN